MSCLYYRGKELFIEDKSLIDIASQFGTPSYVYSKANLITNWQCFDQAFASFPHRICYAVKANSNIAILNILAKLNSGFDIVSLGELERVLAAGGKPENIIFSGVGKQTIEIETAITAGIFCFNVESLPELDRLNTIATHLNKTINISLRINPNIDPGTHSHIATGRRENKFGIDSHEISALCARLNTWPALRLIGIACHIGSQIIDLVPFSLALDHLLSIYHELSANHVMIKHINIGGGLGIAYRDENPPSILEYAGFLQKKLSSYPLEIIIEPGRAIVGQAGVLLTKVEYLKHQLQKNFAIVDAGMNDLIRPALYEAWQTILPVVIRETEKKIYDVVGPVCESADFLGKDRELAIMPEDLLAIDSAGAYGFSMASNYNSRCRPPEILIEGSKTHLIRRRETISDLLAAENLPVIS